MVGMVLLEMGWLWGGSGGVFCMRNWGKGGGLWEEGKMGRGEDGKREKGREGVVGWFGEGWVSIFGVRGVGEGLDVCYVIYFISGVYGVLGGSSRVVLA